jgi:hypothetical protein
MTAINSLPDSNVRSNGYYVARTSGQCRHCGLSTGLLALAMPRNHETVDSDEQASDSWYCPEVHAILFHVELLSDAVQRRLKHVWPHFRLAYSAATLSSYWANHCEHCGTLLDDHDLHCEPDGAFVPSSEAAAKNIELLQVQEPFEAAAAGFAFEPEFFGYMRNSR